MILGNNITYYFSYFFYLAFNVKHIKQLLLDIQQIPFDGELKFASFKIINMYTKVPHKKVSSSVGQMVGTMDIIFTTHKGKHLNTLKYTVYNKKWNKAYKLTIKLLLPHGSFHVK